MDGATAPALRKSGIELLTAGTAADKLPALRGVMTETAGTLAQTLHPAAAAKLDVKLTGIETGRAGDVLAAHAESVASAGIKCEQWDGLMLAGADRGFVLALVDALFGGDGSEPPHQAERPLTKLETAVVTWLFGQVAVTLQAAFKRVGELAFSVDRVDSPPAFDCLGKPSNVIAVASFELKCAGGTGRLFIALPPPALNFLKAIPAPEAPAPKSSVDPGWTRSLGSRVSRAGLSMKAILGSTQLTLGEVASLKPGQLISLDALAENHVRLDCNGQPLYWCKLGQADGAYRLTIEREIDREQEFRNDILSH